MLKRFVIAGVLAGASSLLALSACSGGSRLTPSVAPQSDEPQSTASQSDAPFALAPRAGSTIRSLKWGKLPKAEAGKRFAKAEKIALVAIGADGKPISGAYATPVRLTDSDDLKASELLVDGKPAGAANPVTGSTSAITLAYGGLAIEPAVFTASAAGVKSARTTFAPKVFGIDYLGPRVGGAPEVDLYSTTPSTQGFRGTFTVTQEGWSGKYKEPFTYEFKSIKGKANNCPGPGGAYTVKPASKKMATDYTVTATSDAGAGACLMTMSGGGGKSIGITLTFTTSGIVINARRAP